MNSIPWCVHSPRLQGGRPRQRQRPAYVTVLSAVVYVAGLVAAFLMGAAIATFVAVVLRQSGITERASELASALQIPQSAATQQFTAMAPASPAPAQGSVP